MKAQTRIEKRNAARDKFINRRAAKVATARREGTLLGRIRKEARQCVELLTDVVDAERNPGNPWDDEDDWMVMQ
jgi:hypothetical protein